MATMDDSPLFIDTNMLVYANVIRDRWGQTRLILYSCLHQEYRSIGSSDIRNDPEKRKGI